MDPGWACPSGLFTTGNRGACWERAKGLVPHSTHKDMFLMIPLFFCWVTLCYCFPRGWHPDGRRSLGAAEWWSSLDPPWRFSWSAPAIASHGVKVLTVHVPFTFTMHEELTLLGVSQAWSYELPNGFCCYKRSKFVSPPPPAHPAVTLAMEGFLCCYSFSGLLGREFALKGLFSSFPTSLPFFFPILVLPGCSVAHTQSSVFNTKRKSRSSPLCWFLSPEAPPCSASLSPKSCVLLFHIHHLENLLSIAGERKGKPVHLVWKQKFINVLSRMFQKCNYILSASVFLCMFLKYQFPGRKWKFSTPH